MNKNLFILLLFHLLIFSCVDKHFKIYNLSGERLSYIESSLSTYSKNEFKLYFDRKNINDDFEEVNLIATDYYYYGQFFFDDNFMDMIKIKTLDIGADALIYEKERKDFPNYDKNFLYFTAIKFANK